MWNIKDGRYLDIWENEPIRLNNAYIIFIESDGSALMLSQIEDKQIDILSVDVEWYDLNLWSYTWQILIQNSCREMN